MRGITGYFLKVPSKGISSKIPTLLNPIRQRVPDDERVSLNYRGLRRLCIMNSGDQGLKNVRTGVGGSRNHQGPLGEDS